MSNNHDERYLIVVDYLRVFAMLGVLAVHFSQHFPVQGVVKTIAAMGGSCVQIFFVISAFLGCSYFFKGQTKIGLYYKRRALRILPMYYAAIVAAILYTELFTEGSCEDVFKLGWLRYFLALNTVLPSGCFEQWNNAFGFWVMTDFIFFYALIPFIIKKVCTFKSSVVFFLACFAIACIMLRGVSFENSTGAFPELKSIVILSPLVQMQHFALGMLTYFAVREGKNSFASVICIIMALPAICFASHALLFSLLTCLFILSVKEKDVSLKERPRKWLQFVSKYSFHIYLTHLIALSIGQCVAMSVCSSLSICFCIIKLAITIVVMLVLCCFLEMEQRFASKLFLRES